MLIALSLSLTLASVARVDVARAEPNFATMPPAAWADADPADSLYQAARRALAQKDYEAAAKMFGDIHSRFPRSEYAPDALYWKGFALYRNGDLDKAADALELQAKLYPKAATRGDGQSLLIQVKGQLARKGDEEAKRDVDREAEKSGKGCADMEVQSTALDALQQMDAERALPLLKRVLARRDACSVPLRKNALFMLAQKQGADRERVLLDVAKTDPNLGVRQDAVFHLQQARSDLAVDALEDLLLHSDEKGVRSNAMFALAQNHSERARKILRNFAQLDDATPALRKDALFHLSQNKEGGSDELIGLYDKLPVSLKKEVIFYLAQRRDAAGLDKIIAIAKSDPSPELRKEALFHIGQSKDPKALKALEEILNP